MAKGHKPTNPHWGKSMPLTALYGEQNICQFEQAVVKLQLTPEQYASSAVLRTWVKQHYRQRYVPEFLLVLWDLELPSFED